VTDPQKAYERGSVAVEDGEFAGWRYWPNDTFEVHSGPFYYQRGADGVVRTAYRAQAKNMNGGGAMHGGAYMTFADFSLFAFAWEELGGGQGVTISFSSEFIGASFVGDLIEGTGGIVRATRSLIFLQGQLACEGRPLLTFSGIIKRIGERG